MNKEAGIRNTDKKKPFFDRQIKEFNSGMVSRIEAPNSHFGKNNIPNYKKNSHYHYSGKNSFPSFDIPHPLFKTIKKWNQKGRDI